MASYKSAGTNLYDLFDRFFNEGFSVSTPLKTIILDVQEFNDKYIVEADVPGVDKKDINITFKDDYLKIALEHEGSDESTNTEEASGQTQETTSEQESPSAESIDATESTESKTEDTTEEKTPIEEAATGEEPKSDSEQTTSSNTSNDTNNEGHYIHRERTYAIVNRVIYLKGATSKGIKADLKDGVLTITIPKREDAMNGSQKIEID